jgi:hypothetical protein
MIPHRLEKCGYVPVRNEGAEDGLWKISGKRQVIYSKSAMSIRDRLNAVNKLMEKERRDAAAAAAAVASSTYSPRPWERG